MSRISVKKSRSGNYTIFLDRVKVAKRPNKQAATKYILDNKLNDLK